MRLHKDIIHMCGRNFKSGKQRGAMKGGMGENRAYHTLDTPSAGRASRKKSKARKMPSAPSVARKMRKRKGMRRISPQTHSQAGKRQKCMIFDRNMQESVIRDVFAAERGACAADPPFSVPQAPFRAPRPIFPQEGRKSFAIFPPLCLRAKVFYISCNVRIIFCRVF